MLVQTIRHRQVRKIKKEGKISQSLLWSDQDSRKQYQGLNGGTVRSDMTETKV